MNFSLGNVVKLKSGGPSMTVTYLERRDDGRTTIHLHYFAEDTVKTASFPPEALDLLSK